MNIESYYLLLRQEQSGGRCGEVEGETDVECVLAVEGRFSEWGGGGGGGFSRSREGIQSVLEGKKF